jgi:hypothetical protein
MALLWVLSSLIAGSARAQDVVYSPYEKFDFHNGEYDVIGMTGGTLYTYRNTPDGAQLDAFDDSMNKEATIILDFFPAKIYSTRFVSYPDRIIALYQALESNKVVQYAALMDDKARLKNKPIELGNVKTGIFGAMKTYFYSAVSEDKKKILIYTISDKNGKVEFDGKLLDDSLKLIQHAHTSFSVDKMLTAGEVNVANDGTIYLSSFTTTGSQNYADRYWVLTLAPGETKFVPHPLALDNHFAAAGYLKLDNVNGKVYFGGFYTSARNGNYEGVIFASYDMNTGVFPTTKFIPFDEQLTDKAAHRRRANAFDNFMVRQLIVKNDGGFVMISEVSYMTTRSSFAPGLGYYSNFYSPYNSTLIREFHYDDIMAIAYSKDGVREWDVVIPKEQYSQEDGGVFSSYLLLNTGGAIGFLYNDFNYKQSRIQLSTVEPGGEAHTSSFAAEGSDGPDWLPRAGKQVAARVLIVPCLHKRQICFAKVVF